MARKLMGKLSTVRQRTKCVAVDWFTSFLAFFCFNVFRFFYMKIGYSLQELMNYLLSTKLIIEQLIVPVLLLFIYWLSGYYNRPFERSRLQELLLTLFSQLFNAIVIYLAALTNDQLYLRSENWMLLLILFLLLFSFTYIGRLIVTGRMIRGMVRKDIRPRTVVVGISDEAIKVARKLENPKIKPNGYVIGFLPFGKENSDLGEGEVVDNFYEISVIKNLDALKDICRRKEVDQVIIVPSKSHDPSKKIMHLLYNLYPFDISIKISPDILQIVTPSVRLQDIMGEPFIDLSSPQISEFSKNVKRTIDVIFASFGMIALSPVFAFLALKVKLSSPGKVIYSQERVGIHRKPFRILKFRSMVENAEKDGTPLLSSDNDPRITGVGKWMRKYRLDELPQLWNVLKGDMSLVGPRPEREYYIDQIVKRAPWYTLALQVRPGITSWGMVKYGYASDVNQMIERNRFDLIYLNNMSIAVDFKILIHTVKTVGAGEGK